MSGSDNVSLPGSGQMNRDDPEWARRRAASIRLAWMFGGVAVLVFVLALWKFRPF
jgi:hypothetical protein